MPFTGALTTVLLLLAGALQSALAAEPLSDWRNVVRQTPYWESQGVADNLRTIRQWVLFSESYCQRPQRHLLFDYRFRFLGYIDNAEYSAETLERLNQTRERLADEGRVAHWSPGTASSTGYPFALSCHQPFVDMEEALRRLTSDEADYTLWGSWEGLVIGSADAPVTLIDMFRQVHAHRQAQGRFTFPDTVLPAFLGKIIIESGGQQNALSRNAARGIMQLRPGVLQDCEIPPAFHLHRIAQVDCALRLVQQNHRNLQRPFQDVFGHLPATKQARLYDLLLIQAYQIGVGRSIELLKDETLGAASRYFARQHAAYSAEDILVGMMYHNLGRRDIGLLTLYYVTDVQIAREQLCHRLEVALACQGL